MSSQQRLPPPFFLNPRPKSRSYADILYLCRLPFMTSSFLRCISCPCDASYVHTLSAFVFQLDVSFYAFASLGALSVQSRELSIFFRLNIRGLLLLHFLPSPHVHVSRDRERVVVVSAFHPSSWPLLPLSALVQEMGKNLSVPCLRVLGGRVTGGRRAAGGGRAAKLGPGGRGR